MTTGTTENETTPHASRITPAALSRLRDGKETPADVDALLAENRRLNEKMRLMENANREEWATLREWLASRATDRKDDADRRARLNGPTQGAIQHLRGQSHAYAEVIERIDAMTGGEPVPAGEGQE